MTQTTVKSIPVLDDNYIHVMTIGETDGSENSNSAIIIDPAEAEPVIKYLTENKLDPAAILITHHHNDHIGGVDSLRSRYPKITIFGFESDMARLPVLTHPVTDNQQINVAGIEFDVWHLPGHTSGHIAYISKSNQLAFTGDVLFGMGCGRVFEGTYEEMFNSLQRLKNLPAETRVYCTHEYTVTNGQFAQHMLPDNLSITKQLAAAVEKRRCMEFTVPLLMSEELACNPFLLAGDTAAFSRLRDARNQWKGIPVAQP